MKNIARHSFLALFLLAALRAESGPADAESSMRAAVAAQAAAPQPPPAPATPPAAPGLAAATFGPVIERVVAFNGNESCYDLDTGKFINLSDNDVINEQKVRAAGVDLYFSPISNDLNRLAALDVLLVPLGDKAWDSATPETAREAIARLQKEQASPAYGSAPVVRGTYAFALLKGRAGRSETTVGVLQVLGAVGTAAKTYTGVGIRYKLVQNGQSSSETSPNPKSADVKFLVTQEQITQIQALIKNAPVTTSYLAELFELTPGTKSEYRVRSDVVSLPILPAGASSLNFVPLGHAFYLPAGKKFYIQWDGMGASTQHYYGPFHGDPAQVLGLQSATTGN